MRQYVKRPETLLEKIDSDNVEQRSCVRRSLGGNDGSLLITRLHGHRGERPRSFPRIKNLEKFDGIGGGRSIGSSRDSLCQRFRDKGTRPLPLLQAEF